MNITGYPILKREPCRGRYSCIPSFETFLEAIAFHPEEMYNKHWSPMWNICEPCLIDYDAQCGNLKKKTLSVLQNGVFGG